MVEKKGTPLADLSKDRKAQLIVLCEPEATSVDVQIGDAVYTVTRKDLEQQTDWTYLGDFSLTHERAFKLLSHVSGLTPDEIGKRLGGLSNVGILFVQIVKEMRERVSEQIRGPLARLNQN